MTLSRKKPSLSRPTKINDADSAPRRARTTARVVSDCFAHDVRNAATIAVMNAHAISEQLLSAQDLLESWPLTDSTQAAPRDYDADCDAKEPSSSSSSLQEQAGLEPSDGRLEQLRLLLLDMRQSCDDCMAGVEHIVTLAADLDNLGVEKQHMDVASLVQSAVAIVSAEVRLKARVVTELEPTFIECHPGRLTQMLVNLMLNAAQACSRGPAEDCIRVVARTHDGAFKLSVEDSGCGISADDLETIFKPYVSSRGKGHGLGLALCKTIAEEHHGELACSSEVGRGTIFRFSMPMSHAGDTQ